MLKCPYKSLFLGLSILVFSGKVLAQNEVKGLTINAAQEPLAYATIILYSMPDTTFIKGAVSDDNGLFTIPSIKKGAYACKVSIVGYSPQYTSIFEMTGQPGTYQLGSVMLDESELLDEVVVSAKKPMIEVKPNKIVFNVESSPSAAGSNGLELLSQAPGVTVDMDNNVQLLGKGGVRIFINGRPSRLSGSDLTNLLQNMNADNIENIEVISNPSSKYEASGNAGIISINLKKSVNTGFNGNLSSSLSQGNYFRNSNNLSLNYGGEKVKASLGLSQSDQDFQDNFNDIREQNGFAVGLNSEEINGTGSYGARGDIEFSLGAKHTLNLSGNAVLNQNDNDLESITYISQNDQLDEILFAESLLDGESSNYNSNLNYHFALNKTSNISAELSLGKYTNESSTYQPNRYTEADGETLISTTNRAFDSDTYIDLLSAKLDYEKSWDHVSFSTGSKYVSIATDNQFTFFNNVDLEPTIDLDRSNTFNYTENVFALYGIVDVSLSQLVKLNAGLRMEQTASRGVLESDQEVDNTDVKRAYTNFFPNVGISYNDKKTHALSARIGRRIRRPDYQNLNPFESPQSELSIWKGNPFLNPSFTLNYELSYSFKQQLTVTTQYSETTDYFASLFEPDGDKGSIVIPRNMNNTTDYAVSITYPFGVTDFWDVMAMFNGSYSTFSGNLDGTEIDLTNTNWNFRIQNNLKLPGGINFELTYYQASQWIWRGSILVEGNSNLRFGLRKDFLNDQLQIRITGSDILYTGSEYYYSGDYGGMVIDGVRTFDNRRYGLSATWRFGNQQVKTVKKNKGGLSDELNRL